MITIKDLIKTVIRDDINIEKMLDNDTSEAVRALAIHKEAELDSTT